jgi:hypothetical protein
VRAWGKGTEAAEYLLRTDLNISPDCSNQYLTGLIFVSRPLPVVSFALALGLLFPGPLVMERVSLRGIRKRMPRDHGSREGRSPMGAGGTRRGWGGGG